jgi:sugar lactone lactonase YvrE
VTAQGPRGERLISVDVNSGTRTLVSGSTTSDDEGTGVYFTEADALAIDADARIGYVVDQLSDTVFAVDLVKGQRVIR